MNKDLNNAIVELREEDALRIVKEMIQSGENPSNIVETCKDAMVQIGELFASKEYFLSELVMSGEIFKEIMNFLEPKLQNITDNTKIIGKIVIGTVKGDIHDLGKNIAIGMLKGNGFEVYDLGVDVPPEKFIEKVKELKPDILGMSCVILIGWNSLKDTVNALKKAGLRNKVKVILGGGGISEDVAKFAGADAFITDAIKGVEICKRWVGA